VAIYDGNGDPTLASKGLPTDAFQGKPGALFPENAVESPWGRTEPLLTPEKLKSRFLLGIPLISRFKDPTTGKHFRISDDILKDIIEQAVDVVEEETKLCVFPTQFVEKLPFDLPEYREWGFMKLAHRPCSSLEMLSVTASDDSVLFVVPSQWVDMGNFTYGQINVVPLTLALVNNGIVNSQAGGGAVYLSILGSRPWVPGLWKVQYTAGFKDGILPRPLNRLIGVVAAMDVLSQLAAADARIVGASLGVDGLSQSTSTEGSKRLVQRLQELGEERKLLTKRMRRKYGTGFGFGNV
jgi:hypothetical protein